MSESCPRCEIPMAPGSSHATESNCISALKHQLSQAGAACRACGQAPQLGLCSGCLTKSLAAQGVRAGAKAIGPKLVEWLMRQSTESDSPPPQGGGKRWTG